MFTKIWIPALFYKRIPCLSIITGVLGILSSSCLPIVAFSVCILTYGCVTKWMRLTYWG